MTGTPLCLRSFPSFKEIVERTATSFDAVQNIQWDRITVGDIAAQIGGIPRLSIPISSDFLILALSNPSIPDTWGLPYPNWTETIAQYPCAQSPVCDIQGYTQGIASNPPRYSPAASPLYSDSGFFLLGGALSNMTGMSMDDLYHKSIFKPLGLQNTMSHPPTDSVIINRTAIPRSLEAEFVDVPLTTPSGGIYSTVNDLAKIGTSILNSTLLPTDKTNRWLKPVSFTGDLHYALGRPWEIYRYVHQDSGVVTDIYTKLGDSGDYSGLFVLLPDFDVGFIILGASSLPVHTQAIQLVADFLTDSIIPALMTQARCEALVNLAGTYTPSDKTLNTTLTLSVPASSRSAPGLVIAEWVSNGTDIRDLLATTLLTQIPHIPKPPADANMVRLVPTLQDVAAPGQIAFQMETVQPAGPVTGHLFSKMYDVGDWASSLNQLTYHDIPINEFVFHVDKKTGRASAVTPSAYHVKLQRG